MSLNFFYFFLELVIFGIRGNLVTLKYVKKVILKQ